MQAQAPQEHGQPQTGEPAEQEEERINCVWVFAAGPADNLEASTGWLPAPDRVVAADGGAMLADRLGLVPDLLIGDADSADPALLARLLQQGVIFRRYEHTTKAETDTELAVLAALEWQPEKVYVIGATGGRLDHTLANVLLLTHEHVAPADVRIVEGRQEVFLAKPGRWNQINGQAGDMLTLLPVGDEVTGVITRHLEYPLRGETLYPGRGRGVSNRLLAPPARLRFDSGRLLVVVLHTAPL